MNDQKYEHIRKAIREHTEKMIQLPKPVLRKILTKIMQEHWNYRWIYDEMHGTEWLGLHEVFYDTADDCQPSSWSEEPTAIVVDDHAGAEWLVEALKTANSKPILIVAIGPDGKEHLIESHKHKKHR